MPCVAMRVDAYQVAAELDMHERKAGDGYFPVARGADNRTKRRTGFAFDARVVA